MRRPFLAPLLVLALLVFAGAGCASDGRAPATTTTAPRTTSSTTAQDPELAPLLLRATDLPAGFVASKDVNDTITGFCASEDAAAGLQASGRSVQGFTRTGGGASVIQLAFRFKDDGAAQFVTQARDVLGRCNGVPDIKGLAFDYDALSAELEAAIAKGPASSVGRHGVNVGSGSLSIDVAVVQQGDVGELIAVLGLDLPRADLDAIALAAFGAVVGRL